MQGWLQEEIRDSAKAHELRVKEASELVNAYVSGKLSSEELSEQLYKYDKRWGEALLGSTASPGVSDQEIVNAIDKARDNSFARHTRNIDTARRDTRDKSL
jgi:hypothetical protein